ncbi:MAG: siderophore-interacting protein [Micrococcus sp.]|nr:siderophore-interacting protein [Micrococcus sp.]
MSEAMFIAHTRVVSVEQPCRGFRRIVLAGPDLEAASEDLLGLLPPGVADLHALYRGFRPRRDAYIKVLIPPPGGVSADPDLSAGFRQGFLALAEEERGWMRTYTVRSAGRTRVDGALVPALTIDVVLHGDPQDTTDPHQGPGLRWAREVSAGDSVNILVPTSGAPAWSGWRDTHARRVLAVGDETAVPALISIAEELADPFGGFSGQADLVLELPDGAEAADLIAERLAVPEHWDPQRPTTVAEHGRVRLHVGHRRADQTPGVWAESRLRALLGVGAPALVGAGVGTSGGAGMGVVAGGGVGMGDGGTVGADDDGGRDWSLATVADHERPETSLFLAGEASMVRTLRRLSVNEAGIPKAHISFMGYWRAGQAES